MTPLRQRFIEDLQLRNRAAKTVQAYVLQVRKFVQFYGRSPEQLDAEQVLRPCRPPNECFTLRGGCECRLRLVVAIRAAGDVGGVV